MLVIGGAVLGAVFGALKARKLGGLRLDLWQYGAAFAVMGTLLGVFATIIVHRLAVGV